MPDLKVKWDNLDAAFAELEQEVTAVVRGMLVHTWNSVLVKTPQYYGGLVASWNWTLNPNEAVDRNFMIPDRSEDNRNRPMVFSTPKYRGHPVGIGIANAMNAGKDLKFKLGDVVYFTNGADHGEGAYAIKNEFPEYYGLNQRMYNRPGKMVGRSIDMLRSRYGENVSRSAAIKLKGMRINDVSDDS